MSKIFSSIGRYFQESFEELKKVTWLTRNKAIRLTFIVLGFCLVSAAVMGVLDLAFNRGYQALVSYALRVVPPSAATTTPVAAPTPSPSASTPSVNVNATGPVQVQPIPVTSPNPTTKPSTKPTPPATSPNPTAPKKP